MKPQARTGLLLVVIGLSLLPVTLILGRQFGWPDALRGSLTGLSIGLEILGLIRMLPGLSQRQKA